MLESKLQLSKLEKWEIEISRLVARKQRAENKSIDIETSKMKEWIFWNFRENPKSSILIYCPSLLTILLKIKQWKIEMVDWNFFLNYPHFKHKYWN